MEQAGHVHGNGNREHDPVHDQQDLDHEVRYEHDIGSSKSNFMDQGNKSIQETKGQKNTSDEAMEDEHFQFVQR